MAENPGDYRAGAIDEKLNNIDVTLTSLNGKLDANLEWQRGVDERITRQEERSDRIRKDLDSACDDIDDLEDADKEILKKSSGIGAAIGSAVAVALKIFGGDP